MKPTRQSAISLLSCMILIVCAGVIGTGVVYIARKCIRKAEVIGKAREAGITNQWIAEMPEVMIVPVKWPEINNVVFVPDEEFPAFVYKTRTQVISSSGDLTEWAERLRVTTDPRTARDLINELIQIDRTLVDRQFYKVEVIE